MKKNLDLKKSTKNESPRKTHTDFKFVEAEELEKAQWITSSR